MRALLWITAAAAVLYGGYWFAGSRAAEAGARAALADLQARGLAAPANVSLTGFPSRFDLTVTPVALTTPGGGVQWVAPFLQVFALSYQPNHVIAVWPHDQTLTLGPVRLAVASTDMRASGVVGAATDLPLDRTTFVAKDVTLRAEAGPAPLAALSVADIRLATRRADDTGLAHDLGAELLALRPDPALRARLETGGALPEAADWMRLDATLRLDRPLDRTMVNDAPRPVALTLRDASFRWGDMGISGRGSLTVGPDGVLEGRIDLTATRWRQLLDLAVALGLVKPEVAPTYARALERMAVATSPDRLELPLNFTRGWITLGPLPVGVAPRI